MNFPVYLVRTRNPNPLSDTHCDSYIFVETDQASKHGWSHRLIRDDVSGRHHERRPTGRPEESEHFHDKTLLGSIKTHKYPQRMDRMLEGLLVPLPQVIMDPLRGSEPVQMKVNGEAHAPSGSQTSLTENAEWIEKQAIPALVQARLVV